MNIRILFISLFVLASMQSQAQPPTHIPLMNDTWKLIAERLYKKNSNFKMVPAFPSRLKAMQDKIIEMPGYIIPINAGVEHTEFMFAVVPYDQCPYCGQGDIPAMIEVKTTSGIRYSDKPVKIRGKLLLNESGDSRSEVFLVNAELVK